MTVIALARGLAGVFRPRLLLAGWLLTVVLALAVAVPHGRVLEDAVKHLPDPAAKAERLEAPWWDDVRRTRAPALAALGDVAGAVTWLHVLLAAVMTGGVAAAFDRRAARRRREEGRLWGYGVFLADCGRHALPMLRMLALSLPLFYVMDLALNTGLGKLVDRYLMDIENERVGITCDWLRQGLFLAGVFAVATWFDHARAKLVVDEQRSALVALSASIVSLARRPFPVLTVAAVFLGAELAAMVVGAGLVARLETGSIGELAAWIAATQLLILLRVGLGFGRIAGLVALAEEEREDRLADEGGEPVVSAGLGRGGDPLHQGIGSPL